MLPETAAVNANGHLTLGGCDVSDLAQTYGTPLYVYDEATIRGRAGAYRDALKTSYEGESLVCYAGKAYCAPWLLKVLADEQLGLDVVSGGELFAAQRAGFPVQRIYFHGNNKSDDELFVALEAAVRRVVVDNMEEVQRLSRLAAERVVEQAVLLRVAPGVEAHTHAHILTGAPDTKFGVSIDTGAARQVAQAIQHARGLKLMGLHAHIGSQIFEVEPYQATVRKLFDFAAELDGFDLRELSPGGGFGMRYTAADAQPLAPEAAAKVVAEAVTSEATRRGWPLPELTIEPGRSIVGPAAVAVYRVGSIKDIPGVRTYVAVDGGMADNIRPATYGARYAAVLANRMCDEATDTVAVAGRYCESGDVLIRDAKLPMPQIGDLVAIPGSGAYQLSMASNYNLVPRPAVVVVTNGKARLVRRRETYDDLLSAEVMPS
ncbi:MAG TPA: diaminopimelate decarboxylase [Chloroflexota bacterium]|nr:diaminopimelate decarboxylase [Chloroflexota bacterium]